MLDRIGSGEREREFRLTTNTKDSSPAGPSRGWDNGRLPRLIGRPFDNGRLPRLCDRTFDIGRPFELGRLPRLGGGPSNDGRPFELGRPPRLIGRPLGNWRPFDKGRLLDERRLDTCIDGRRIAAGDHDLIGDEGRRSPPTGPFLCCILLLDGPLLWPPRLLPGLKEFLLEWRGAPRTGDRLRRESREKLL